MLSVRYRRDRCTRLGEWPSRSQDMRPIDLVVFHLKKRVLRRQKTAFQMTRTKPCFFGHLDNQGQRDEPNLGIL